MRRIGRATALVAVAGWALAAGLVLLVAARLLGVQSGTLPALTMGLLPLLMLGAYPVLLAAMLLRRRRLAVLAVLLVGAQLLLAAPSLSAEPRPCAGTRLRVVVANLLKSNPDPERAGRLLLSLRPDVLIVPELSERARVGLRDSGLLALLTEERVRDQAGRETVGLYSSLLLRDAQLLDVGEREWPRATVDVGGVPVRLLAVHPFPPVSPTAGRWRRSLAALDREVQATAGPLVAAGDFNADRDHASFRALLDGGVRDAHDELGRGLARTWPQPRPLLHLDHVLVRDGEGGQVAVCGVREQELPGSDHRAVVADLAVQR